MESLISFDGASDVLNNFIDKLSAGIGWLATHDTPMRIAVDTFIKDIQSSDFDPTTKAVLISNARKIIKEYRNQYKVASVACQNMLPTAKPEQVDDDWLAQFMDKARLVSDEQFQILWGNILAEECNNPNSIPKSLLHIMEQMDKNMAEAFMNIAALSVWYEHKGKKTYAPIITGVDIEEYYKNLGINYGYLVELQSVGLIKMNFGFVEYSFALTPNTVPIIVHYHDQEYTIPNNKGEFAIGNIVYTNAGEALCKTISPQKVEGFLEDCCIPFWERTCK